MKARHQFHPDLGYVDITIEGRVTLPEMGEYVQALWADPEWKSDYNGLIDFSAATIDFSEQEVLTLTRAMRTDPRCSLGRWAFVVSRASDFGKLRMIDRDDHHAIIRVFFDRPSAERAGLQLSSRSSGVSPGASIRDPRR